jgi:hypothetical protein
MAGFVSNCVICGNSAQFGGGVSGGTLSDSVLIGNFAVSAGGGAENCTLSGCRLTNNSALVGGGGAEGSTLSNCMLVANSVYAVGQLFPGFGGGASGCTLKNCALLYNSIDSSYSLPFSLYGGDGYGGGAYGCELNNCLLVGNYAQIYGFAFDLGYVSGGGAVSSALNNCTLSYNRAIYWLPGGFGGWVPSDSSYGGGTVGCTMNNCIVFSNISGGGFDDNNYGALGMDYCCTTPMPATGVGNITNVPLFVDPAGGNFRLQSNSPCINAGNNDHVMTATDLDGNPRIAGETVDIGAYEFQNPTSLISYAWLQQYGLPTDGSADFTDPDGDGINDWEEWRCQTDPTDPLSALRLLPPSVSKTNVTVSWQSVAGVNYFVECSTSLAQPAVFTQLATNIPGQPGTTRYSDTNATRTGPVYYRIGVTK